MSTDTPIADAIHARTKGGIHEENYIDALQSVKDLERENARLREELAYEQKECGTAIRKSLNEIRYREMAEEEADKWLRLCTEWSEANVKLIQRAEQAEAELALKLEELK